jgi:hypothetical protein
MADYTNYDRMTKALALVADALAPFLERELKRTGQGWWTTHVLANVSPLTRQKLPSVPAKGVTGQLSGLDLADLLNLAAKTRQVLKGGKMPHAFRTYAEELRDTRNRWAHRPAGGDIAADDADRAIDTAARLLDEVDPTAAAAVRALKAPAAPAGTAAAPPEVTPPAAAVEPPKQSAGAGPAAGLRPWRDGATPRADVRTGSLTKDQFAADLHEVFRGTPTVAKEYSDAREFFDRTYVTAGLREFLRAALARLTDRGGQPIVQLKTGFGGGKTHTMLALYHMARSGADIVNDVPVLKELSQELGVAIPKARVAVLVGTKLSPTAPWDGEPELKSLGLSLKTLWGHMAWQLGGYKAYKIVQTADDSGVAPGEELREVLQMAAPCVILIDELVAYGRKLAKGIPGGTLESNMSFVQTLTELAKATPGVVVAASIPESEMEIGGVQGQQVLRRLEQTFGRLETPWEPVQPQESFEVVRRRLFERVDPGARDQAAAAFTKYYRENSIDFPQGVGEREYEEQMRAAYPFHPEVFERLYQDWKTMPEFQSTRGVLRLLAGVVQALWQDDDRSALIQPATIPFSATPVREEVLRYLPSGFSAVLDADIEGPGSKAVLIDAGNPRFGRTNAARSLARAILLGSAPGRQNPGLEDVRVLLGAAVPGESVSAYRDALGRLQDHLEYLHSAGKRYWFELRPNLNRTVADRVSRLTIEDALSVALERLKRDTERAAFAAKHVAPADSGDVPDDAQLRLVVLGPEATYRRDEPESPAVKRAREMLLNRGATPRLHRNMVVFAAFDEEQFGPLTEAAKLYTAWSSILAEKSQLRLSEDQVHQAQEAREKASAQVDTLLQQGYHWVIVPDPGLPSEQQGAEGPAMRAIDIGSSLSAAGGLAAKVQAALEHADLLVTTTWSPKFLKKVLEDWFWSQGMEHLSLRRLWEEYLARYTYLPRLKDIDVLRRSVQDGATARDFFGYAHGVDDGRYVGLSFGERPGSVNVDSAAVIVSKEAAERQLAAESVRNADGPGTKAPGGRGDSTPSGEPPETPRPAHHRYWARVALKPSRVASSATDISNEIIRHLLEAGADVEVHLEIAATVREGLRPELELRLAENSRTLGFDFGFEEE